jgi:hypothetical protein
LILGKKWFKMMSGFEIRPGLRQNSNAEFIRKWRLSFLGFNFRPFFLWLCIVGLLGSMLASSGCRTRTSRVKQQQKAIEKRKEEKRKQQQEVYTKTLEHHRNIQGNDGKRRLEEAQKHRNELDKRLGKNTSWLKRLFSKDKGGCGPK